MQKIDSLCCSVYDTKPIHIMSTVAEYIEWDEKDQKVWSSELGSRVSMKYLCLNLIGDYNIHMNSVDLADQLCNCYRFNHWFWNRKWWWAIFLWAIGIAATNGYIMCEHLYEEEKESHKSMPREWNHLEFLCELVFDFFGFQTDEAVLDDDAPVSCNTRSAAGSVVGSVSVSTIAAVNVKYDFSTARGREAFF